MRSTRRQLLTLVPITTASALMLGACGGGSSQQVAVQPAAPGPDVAAAQTAVAPAKPMASAAVPITPVRKASTAKANQAGAARPANGTSATKAAPAAKAPGGAQIVHSNVSADQKAADQKIYDEKNGATDVGVTRDQIKLGSVNMHGMALGNVITRPQAISNQAAAAALNDRGGVLGRRVTITDCDDGPGEVSRAKACIKKLVGQDHIFSMITSIDWATASIHDDLKQNHLPYVGAWAYSQTEWQDPFMFPTHMSMIHEAMAGAHWASNVVKPKTYGLICLTSPEMQIACNAVGKIMDAGGAKLVKRVDVSISETSMSAYVLSMRAAAPEHIIHYVINPSTMAKFMVESAQQGYYPPKGISGNHLATEILGSIFGNWPAGRYWTNTTYKLWGPEMMAVVAKYGRGAQGQVHHIIQAGYMAINTFALASREVGPNLTRDRLMAQLGNGTVWKSDASQDQKFSWVQSERFGDHWSTQNGNGREFMYKYNSSNTVANPDFSPSGFEPDPNQFVIYTDH